MTRRLTDTAQRDLSDLVARGVQSSRKYRRQRRRHFSSFDLGIASMIFTIRLALLLAALAIPSALHADEGARRDSRRQVTITRDDWGIAHIHGASDADAVFGMIYAQAEDDFARIEDNYLVALGRSAEAKGASAIMSDLRQRLFTDPAVLKRDFARAPRWLKSLMIAWADGLNHFLATHSAVKPKVITHFEPWMA